MQKLKAVCADTPIPHAHPLPPSGGAFGTLLCRKEFLLNCSSHSPPDRCMPLRSRSCGAAVLLSATCHRSSCACGRAGFGSEEQRLLQTPDLVVLLISYLLKKMLLLLVCMCVCLFRTVEVFHPNVFNLLQQRSN